MPCRAMPCLSLSLPGHEQHTLLPPSRSRPRSPVVLIDVLAGHQNQPSLFRPCCFDSDEGNKLVVNGVDNQSLLHASDLQ
ncbi:hypothetical protein RchiOBHm_Chr3g0458471 [Rosa chinensis]|uniref:Uncharacterized protein n=1 Tax=Rosa chinensis TaxID=74649 RepID=A0A2P6R7U8_ROSCH|nr:hypothetical protein RchiOBHm_Chr3g0458471 [Rosa chinensis]